MGVCSSKKQRKENELMIYETSDEQWVFGQKHLNAIKESLQIVQLQMLEEIILEYLGGISEWNHPNYATYIHLNGTPLDNNLDKLFESDYVPEYKVVVLGRGGVGKSSITLRFVMDTFDCDWNDPTIEDSYRKEVAVNVPKDHYDEQINFHGTQRVLLDILDTAPNNIDVMYDGWMRCSQIHILVFSVVDQESFEDIKLLRDKIIREKDSVDVAIIVVGNKCDLRTDLHNYDDGNTVDMDRVFEFCKANKHPYIETSAKTGKNVTFLFRQCVHECQWLIKHGTFVN